MAVRLLLGLSGLMLGYGLVTGAFVVGMGFALFAVVVTVAVERSLRATWALLLTAGAFPAFVGVQTFGLPDCGVALALGTKCLAAPERRWITLASSSVVALAIGLAVWDRRRRR
jgi:hypothetical protein